MPKLKENDDFDFDDCPICQAMKRADMENRELGLKELKKAFKKARQKVSPLAQP